MSVRRLLKVVGINVLVLVLVLLVVEGAASFLRVGAQVVRSSPIPERYHTEYDEELGWINLPDVTLSDMYGPGVGFQTNSQRFRNANAFPEEVPDGHLRIVCSGDSFTLGVGVANEDTWCHLLSSEEDRIETVNMGQGGYGLDQAYLWYRRDGVELEHDIHLFAFITEDFWRMYSDSFQGYGKPLLQLEEGAIVVKNSPVPKGAYRLSWLARTLPILAELNTVQLGHEVLRRLGWDGRSSPHDLSDSDVRQIVSRILDDLDATNRQKDSRLVLVYLPAMEDYMGVDDTRMWKQFMREEAAVREIPFVDVVDALREIPPTEIAGMFGSHHHYTEAGNAFVAQVIASHLDELTPPQTVAAR